MRPFLETFQFLLYWPFWLVNLPIFVAFNSKCPWWVSVLATATTFTMIMLLLSLVPMGDLPTQSSDWLRLLGFFPVGLIEGGGFALVGYGIKNSSKRWVARGYPGITVVMIALTIAAVWSVAYPFLR